MRSPESHQSALVFHPTALLTQRLNTNHQSFPSALAFHNVVPACLSQNHIIIEQFGLSYLTILFSMYLTSLLVLILTTIFFLFLLHAYNTFLRHDPQPLFSPCPGCHDYGLDNTLSKWYEQVSANDLLQALLQSLFKTVIQNNDAGYFSYLLTLLCTLLDNTFLIYILNFLLETNTSPKPKLLL